MPLSLKVRHEAARLSGLVLVRGAVLGIHVAWSKDFTHCIRHRQARLILPKRLCLARALVETG